MDVGFCGWSLNPPHPKESRPLPRYPWGPGRTWSVQGSCVGLQLVAKWPRLVNHECGLFVPPVLLHLDMVECTSMHHNQTFPGVPKRKYSQPHFLRRNQASVSQQGVIRSCGNNLCFERPAMCPCFTCSAGSVVFFGCHTDSKKGNRSDHHGEP